MTGRALMLFRMSNFMGVAVMQWFTGWVASAAKALGAEIHTPVLLNLALRLVAGALGFAWLPKARQAPPA